jgi:hypothetical protein
MREVCEVMCESIAGCVLLRVGLVALGARPDRPEGTLLVLCGLYLLHVRQERETLKQEREALKQEREALKQESEALRQEREQVTAERDTHIGGCGSSS